MENDETQTPVQTAVVEKKSVWRFRHTFSVFGIIIALAVLFLTDPSVGIIKTEYGASVLSKLSSIVAMVFAVPILYWGRKALYDYLDISKFFERAYESPTGAGLALIAVSVSVLALALLTMGLIATFS